MKLSLSMTTKNKLKMFTLWVSISLNLMINIKNLRIGSRSMNLKFNDSSLGFVNGVLNYLEIIEWSII